MLETFISFCGSLQIKFCDKLIGFTAAPVPYTSPLGNDSVHYKVSFSLEMGALWMAYSFTRPALGSRGCNFSSHPQDPTA